MSERRLLLIVFVVAGGLFGVGMGLVFAIRADAGAPWWGAVLAGISTGAIFGGAMTWFTARTWRRAGGFSIARRMQAAARSGRVPSDADPELWLPLLDRQEQEAAR